jgi:hypothetical protein
MANHSDDAVCNAENMDGNTLLATSGQVLISAFSWALLFRMRRWTFTFFDHVKHRKQTFLGITSRHGSIVHLVSPHGLWRTAISLNHFGLLSGWRGRMGRYVPRNLFFFCCHTDIRYVAHYAISASSCAVNMPKFSGCSYCNSTWTVFSFSQ